jgi:2-keto-4-pentenoate hydratase/2-oxohepta-3-ene-1,7-dioic acid hydratase in catechol pathway
VLGYTCFNDVTARDLQREDGQWTRAKSFDTFAPVGPFIATELNPRNAEIITRVNGKLRQSSNTRNLIFDVDYLVRFVSRIMTLEAGDIIATGTPQGVGQLKSGDTVEVEIPGIGTLSNGVIDESNEALRLKDRLKPRL